MEIRIQPVILTGSARSLVQPQQKQNKYRRKSRKNRKILFWVLASEPNCQVVRVLWHPWTSITLPTSIGILSLIPCGSAQHTLLCDAMQPCDNCACLDRSARPTDKYAEWDLGFDYGNKLCSRTHSQQRVLAEWCSKQTRNKEYDLTSPHEPII